MRRPLIERLKSIWGRIPTIATLAALVAFLGGVGALISQVTGIFHQPDADVSLGTPIATNIGSLIVPIDNKGDRSAMITSSTVVLMTTNARQEGELELHSEPNYDTPFDTIEAKNNARADGIPRHSFLALRQFVRDHKGRLARCSVEMTGARWHGFQRLSQDFSCEPFVSILETATPPGQ
jgi:hypothetical protein